jgi:hypothetical protein
MGEDSGSDAPWGIVSIKAQDVDHERESLASPSPLPFPLLLFCASCSVCAWVCVLPRLVQVIWGSGR